MNRVLSGWTPRQHANYLIGIVVLVSIAFICVFGAVDAITAYYDAVYIPLIGILFFLGLIAIWNMLALLALYIKGMSTTAHSVGPRIWPRIGCSILSAVVTVLAASGYAEIDNHISYSIPSRDEVREELFPVVSSYEIYKWVVKEENASKLQGLIPEGSIIASIHPPPSHNPTQRADYSGETSQERLRAFVESVPPRGMLWVSDEIRRAIQDSALQYRRSKYLMPAIRREFLLRILLVSLSVAGITGAFLIPRRVWQNLEESDIELNTKNDT